MIIKRNCWKGACRCTSSGFVWSISCLCCLFSATSLNSSLDTGLHTKFAFGRVKNPQAVQTTGKTNGSWVVGKFKATSMSQFIKKKVVTNAVQQPLIAEVTINLTYMYICIISWVSIRHTTKKEVGNLNEKRRWLLRCCRKQVLLFRTLLTNGL